MDISEPQDYFLTGSKLTRLPGIWLLIFPPAVGIISIMKKSAVLYLLTLMIIILSVSCKSSLKEPVSESEILLGTTCFITVYDMNGRQSPEEALSGALNEIRLMEERLSVEIESSEISVLNRLGQADVSGDTAFVLNKSLEMARLSSGRFDPTIGVLVALWGIGSDKQIVPMDSDIQSALRLIDYNLIRVDEKQVSLERKGMMVDLGGIAKGHAADLAKKELIKAGVTSSIINLGGNIQLIGSKPDGSPWRIGIQNPADSRGQYIGILEAIDKAVVTSGIYERYFTAGDRHYHHILDTKTGYPVDNGIQSMTVITGNSMLADGLSTALFSMGVEDSLDYASSHKDIDIIIIDSLNNVYLSSNIKDKFRLTNDTDFRYAP